MSLSDLDFHNFMELSYVKFRNKLIITLLLFFFLLSCLITQATLGLGTSMEKSILQCTIGLKSPIFLCSLRPHATESCPLNLELDNGDFVTFSIIGARSIHLSGYFALDESDIDDNDKMYPFDKLSFMGLFAFLMLFYRNVKTRKCLF